MMQIEGTTLDGLELGNAWDLRAAGSPTNWIVGQTAEIAAGSLRFLRQGGPDGAERVSNLCVKWFVHDPSDPTEWGENKPVSEGRTLSILAGDGLFEYEFEREGKRCRVVLEKSGDFAVWGAGLRHAWRPLKRSTVVTVRWVKAD